MIEKIIELIKNNLWETVGTLIAFFSLIVPIIQFLNQKKLEEKDKRFINYHRLVKEFVEPEPPNNFIKLDRQIAVAYEFRNYPNYFDLTERLLNDLRTQWMTTPNIQRLHIEIDLTLKYIKYKRKNFIFKFFIRVLGNKP